MTLVQDRYVTVTFLGGTLVFCLVPLALILYFRVFFLPENLDLEKNILIRNPRPEALWDWLPEEPESVG